MRRQLVLGLVGGAVAVGGIAAFVVAPRNVQSRTVPPHLREGRWEMSIEGRQVRALTESTCGELPDGVWLDRPDPGALPVLLDASDSLDACYEEQVLPQLRTQR